MIYHLQTSPKFDKQIKKLDKTGQKQIIDYLLKNVENSSNPRSVGKALVGTRNRLWRYRSGNYRIICDIQDNECIVLALETAHRKDIYRP